MNSSSQSDSVLWECIKIVSLLFLLAVYHEEYGPLVLRGRHISDICSLWKHGTMGVPRLVRILFSMPIHGTLSFLFYLGEHMEQDLHFVFFVAWLPIKMLWCEIIHCITNVLGTRMIWNCRVQQACLGLSCLTVLLCDQCKLRVVLLYHLGPSSQCHYSSSASFTGSGSLLPTL